MGEVKCNVDQDFIHKLMQEHPACRAEVSVLVAGFHDLKKDFEIFQKEIRERLPSANPWAGRIVASIISILTTATFMYTVLLVPIARDLTAVETRVEVEMLGTKGVQDIVSKTVDKIKFPWDESRIQAAEKATQNLQLQINSGQSALREEMTGLRSDMVGVRDSIHRIELVVARTNQTE